MSRPKFIGVTWATGTNYPAGADPWSATALKVAPAGTYLTPRTAVAAQEMNYLLNGVVGDTNALRDLTAHLPAINWSEDQFGDILQGDSAILESLAWSAPHRMFFLGYNTTLGGTTTFRILASADGVRWVAAGASPTNTSGISYAAPFVFGGNVHFWNVAPLTQRIEYYTTGNFWGFYTDVSMPTWNSSPTIPAPRSHVFSGRVLTAGYANNGVIGYKVASSANMTTWSVATLPSMTNAEVILLSAGATVAVAVNAYWENASNINYCTTTDGVTWTSRTFSTLFMGSNFSIRAISYDEAAEQFVLIVKRFSGTLMCVTSSDGVTWNIRMDGANFVSGRVTDLVCLGSLYVALASEVGSTFGALMFSIDSGVTWRDAEARLGPDTSLPITTFAGLTTNGRRILAFNGTSIRVSGAFGLSPSL